MQIVRCFHKLMMTLFDEFHENIELHICFVGLQWTCCGQYFTFGLLKKERTFFTITLNVYSCCNCVCYSIISLMYACSSNQHFLLHCHSFDKLLSTHQNVSAKFAPFSDFTKQNFFYDTRERKKVPIWKNRLHRIRKGLLLADERLLCLSSRTDKQLSKQSDRNNQPVFIYCDSYQEDVCRLPHGCQIHRTNLAAFRNRYRL